MADITENLLEQTALENISPNIPPDVISEAVRKIVRTDLPQIARLHNCLISLTKQQ